MGIERLHCRRGYIRCRLATPCAERCTSLCCTLLFVQPSRCTGSTCKSAKRCSSRQRTHRSSKRAPPSTTHSPTCLHCARTPTCGVTGQLRQSAFPHSSALVLFPEEVASAILARMIHQLPQVHRPCVQPYLASAKEWVPVGGPHGTLCCSSASRSCTTLLWYCAKPIPVHCLLSEGPLGRL
jgi:hypothetical protein